MDPERRDMYVEGRRDSIFFRWLTGGSIRPGSRIVEISFVDVPGDIKGGNRGRLARLADVIGRHDRLLCFLDADFDRLHGRSHAAVAALTDGKDLEGYLLRQECVDKLLALALTSDLDGRSVLSQLCNAARPLGLLRIASLSLGLDLPFQNTKLEKHVSFKRNVGFDVDLDAYLRALLQNGHVSIARTSEVLAELEICTKKYAGEADRQIAHGKDVMVLVSALFDAHKVAGGEAAFWSTYQLDYAQQEPNLTRALKFLM